MRIYHIMVYFKQPICCWTWKFRRILLRKANAQISQQYCHKWLSQKQKRYSKCNRLIQLCNVHASHLPNFFHLHFTMSSLSSLVFVFYSQRRQRTVHMYSSLNRSILPVRLRFFLIWNVTSKQCSFDRLYWNIWDWECAAINTTCNGFALYLFHVFESQKLQAN